MENIKEKTRQLKSQNRNQEARQGKTRKPGDTTRYRKPLLERPLVHRQEIVRAIHDNEEGLRTKYVVASLHGFNAQK